MDEDDIYGEDIYGGVSEPNNDVALHSNNGTTHQGPVKLEQASGTGRLGSQSFLHQEDQATNLQGQLNSTQASLQEWHSVFQGVAANAGLPLDPAAILSHLQQTHQQAPATIAAGSTASEDISQLRQRESQLQAQLMEKILENMELRRHLHAAKAAAEPNVVQVRQLLLDPAVNHEFERILKALEEKTAEAKRLNQELNGTTFTYESKQGRMLMAKCKLLADENEEMGRELSEDRFHKLERQLALAKGFAEDMQAAFQECEDHATALDEEAEKIQEENFKLRRTVQEMETRAQRPPQFGMKAGLRDGNRPFIPYNNRPPFHSPPVQRPYARRPVDSAVPPNKRGMAPDRRDEGDRSYSRPRVR
ncbi:hypothetical protein ABBQ32_005426 [Trebouxia sp. C0010 RCD-2024]